MPAVQHLLLALPTALLAGCGLGGSPSASPPASEVTPHTHGPGSEHVSMVVGDGTRDHEVGYSLAGVSLPARAGEPGRVGFQVIAADGRPQREYLTAQTKDLHLYVVREDLAVFRHLHPTLDEDGSWSAPLTLPEPGDYRVVVELVARDEGGNGDALLLGSTATVRGPWQPEPVTVGATGTDGVVVVRAEGSPSTGKESRLDFVVADQQGRAVGLESYLGASGHVTAFHRETGTVVHAHPLGEPSVEDRGTRLSFHTELADPGDYLAFVQVRVDGFLHTVPVAVSVS